MGSEPEKATLLSHIYGAIAESRCSHLIGLIYDRIMCLSGRSSLTSSQTSAILSLLRLPYKNIPDSVSCADLCELVEKNFHAKYGTAQDKALGQKSAQKCAEDDEANIDELKVLGALNALRRSAKCCAAPASLRLIREENLVSLLYLVLNEMMSCTLKTGPFSLDMIQAE
ncbi:hypothetical protein Tcan_08425 [Toxocara canis]|uniref:Uncharacterized protein n=1 Tax=Toxocara canis TaxID=6265 RepID=A0A0B2VRV5_TOXCA|nr:hypothetical protein Tcan_08425 [Toxocara canis]